RITAADASECRCFETLDCVDARPAERRLDLCFKLRAHSNDSTALCCDQLNGHALRGVDAGFCGASAPWRSSHAWLPDGRARRGGTHIGAVTGALKIGARAFKDDSHCCGCFWNRADRFRALACFVALAAPDAVYGFWHDAGIDG